MHLLICALFSLIILFLHVLTSDPNPLSFVSFSVLPVFFVFFKLHILHLSFCLPSLFCLHSVCAWHSTFVPSLPFSVHPAFCMSLMSDILFIHLTLTSFARCLPSSLYYRLNVNSQNIRDVLQHITSCRYPCRSAVGATAGDTRGLISILANRREPCDKTRYRGLSMDVSHR